jgi:hypothetical protein
MWTDTWRLPDPFELKLWRKSFADYLEPGWAEGALTDPPGTSSEQIVHCRLK